MNKDEQLIMQVLNAYNSGKIDFSQVPALEEMVLEATTNEVERYTNRIDQLISQRIGRSLQEIDDQIQTKLNQLDLDKLKEELLQDIRVEKENLTLMSKEIQFQKDQNEAYFQKKQFEKFEIIIINIVCLLCFLVVGGLLGQWFYRGVWDGWGLHILWDTVVKIQPEHPYAAVVLGLGGFCLIGMGIYASFRLMYYVATSWSDERPKILKKIFPKK